MVDEAIWNLAKGGHAARFTEPRYSKGSPLAKGVQQAAGGQLAIIHQKISEYSLKLEAVLSESKATINIGEAIG